MSPKKSKRLGKITIIHPEEKIMSIPYPYTAAGPEDLEKVTETRIVGNY